MLFIIIIKYTYPNNNNETNIPPNSILYNNSLYIEFKSNNIQSNSINQNNQKEPLILKFQIASSYDNIIDNRKKQNKNKIKKSNSENNKNQHNNNNDNNNNNKEIPKTTIEEEIFINNNKYYYNIEDNIIMKYSLNRANRSRRSNKFNSMSFNCYDIYCMGRAHASILYKKFDNKEILYLDKFIVKNPHTLSKDQHVFIIYQKVERDIKNNNINSEDLKNIIMQELIL